MGQVGRPLVKRDRGGVPFGRILWPRFQRVSSHRHVPPQSNVRHIIPNGVRSNFGLPVFSPPVRAMGHNYRRSYEGLGEISRGAKYFRVRVLYANRSHEPSDQQEIREKIQRGDIFRRYERNNNDNNNN